MRKDAVVFKGTREGVLLVLDDQLPLAVVKERLRDKLLSGKAFHRGAKVVLDIGGRELSRTEFAELAGMLTDDFGLVLLRVTTGGDETEQGIPPFTCNWDGVHFYPGSDWMAETQALFVRRTIRSGQQLNYPGSIIVMGDINPGAEVIAGGNIIILGRCRGIAHAGAAGDNKAAVIALRLQPSQLRIANFLARPPEGVSCPPYPEIARIRDERVVIEPLAVCDFQRKGRYRCG